MFSGVEKGCIGNKWVKESAKLRLLLGFMSCVGRVSRVGCVGQSGSRGSIHFRHGSTIWGELAWI